MNESIIDRNKVTNNEKYLQTIVKIKGGKKIIMTPSHFVLHVLCTTSAD